MDTEFWQERWRRNEIGFHQAEGNASLRAVWERLPVARGARVLVPLCGKSVDMAWLCERDCSVVGVELSMAAVDAFLSEQALVCERREAAGELLRLRARSYEFFVGDFFALDRKRLGSVDAVVDRAALIALPAEMRQRYARHLLDLSGEAPIVLVTLEYPPAEMDGPPFSVSASEVESLFGSERRAEHLHERNALGAACGLRARGLTRLVEHGWLLSALR